MADLIILIAVLVMVILTLGAFLADFNTRINRQEAIIINILYLSSKGWRSLGRDPETIRFKASDEKEWRTFETALTRQLKLDEIQNYNLPTEITAPEHRAHGWLQE